MSIKNKTTVAMPTMCELHRWTDGWHRFNDLLYRVENGLFVDGVCISKKVKVYPCCRNGWGGYIRVQKIANKRNFEKIEWISEEGDLCENARRT